MKKIIYPILLICLLGITYLQLNQSDLQLDIQTIDYQAEIRGEVQNPGIYSINKDETLEDLIEKAGGLSDNADLETLSLLKPIKHKDVIIIPKKDEELKISINSASLEELMTLSGIGESKAKNIIEYREHQSFLELSDIMNVKGIGEKIFEKIKNHICL